MRTVEQECYTENDLKAMDEPALRLHLDRIVEKMRDIKDHIHAECKDGGATFNGQYPTFAALTALLDITQQLRAFRERNPENPAVVLRVLAQPHVADVLLGMGVLGGLVLDYEMVSRYLPSSKGNHDG